MDARIPTQSTGDEADRQGMGLLAQHVPLTLLIDLVAAESPGSREILLDERPSEAELAWLASA